MRKYYYLNTYICGVASFAYFAMFSGDSRPFRPASAPIPRLILAVFQEWAGRPLWAVDNSSTSGAPPTTCIGGLRTQGSG